MYNNCNLTIQNGKSEGKERNERKIQIKIEYLIIMLKEKNSNGSDGIIKRSETSRKMLFISVTTFTFVLFANHCLCYFFFNFLCRI